MLLVDINQHARLELRFQRQRDVHGHLVAVEVGVERRADQGMQLDRLAFDQHRLERLDAEMQVGRGSEHGCSRITSSRISRPRDALFRPTSWLLHRGGQTLGVEARIDERLEQFERHLLRQAALMQPQFGTDQITERPE